MSNDPLLQVQGLCTAFATPSRTVRVVDEVSFDMEPGQVLALVGESGCGKTVTALSLLGLLPNGGYVESGEVVFRGRHLFRQSEQEWRKTRGREIGMVFQNPSEALNPLWSIGFQLQEALVAHEPLGKRESRKRAIACLGEVGIPDPERRLGDYPHQLSGGMLQRVMLAIALCGRPSLLIADEPTTALDVTIQAQILNLLEQYLDQGSLSLLLISHDLGVVAELADRVAIMYAGRLVEWGEADEMFSKRLHPYTEGLLRSLPPLDRRLDRLPMIPGSAPDPGERPLGCHFAERCEWSEERCQAELPLLEPAGPSRQVACHFPLSDGARTDFGPVT